MNKEEFQFNRVRFKELCTVMFNQMNNMYDQLALQDQKIEKARKEGYECGKYDGLIERADEIIDSYVICDESELSESGLALRKKVIDAVRELPTVDAIPVEWIQNWIFKNPYFMVTASMLVGDWQKEQRKEEHAHK